MLYAFIRPMHRAFGMSIIKPDLMSVCLFTVVAGYFLYYEL